MIPSVRRTALLLLSAAVIAASSTSCGEAARPRPRLVVLYATCTLNRDYLSPYNPKVSFTPNLEALAQRSTVFESHRTESAQSGIAFASIFTGTQAPVHDVFSHPRQIPDSVELITEAFAAVGYDPWAYLQHFLAAHNLGYAQGVPRGQSFFKRLQPDHKGFRRVLDRLQADPGYRAFVVTNFTVTHAPYSDARLDAFCRVRPEECRIDPSTIARMKAIHYAHPNIGYDFDRDSRTRDFDAAERADFAAVLDLLYRANVHYLDGLVGELVGALEERGLMESTVIAFTADHGETLDPEGRFYGWGHGYQLSPAALDVPLILYAPGAETSGGRIPGVTRSIDVFPTLAGLAGVPLGPQPGRGVDLSPVLFGEDAMPALPAYSHSSVLSDPVANGPAKHLEFFASHFPRRSPDLMWVALRQGGTVYKLRRLREGAFEPSVFEVDRDPAERVDVFDPRSESQREWLGRLSDYRENLVRAFRAGADPDAELPQAQQEELLRALGYIE